MRAQKGTQSGSATSGTTASIRICTAGGMSLWSESTTMSWDVSMRPPAPNMPIQNM